MSGDITAFIVARLEEDEAAAKKAAHKRRSPWRVLAHRYRALVYGVRGCDFYVADTPSAAIAEHIARHDPARALHEVDAKRRRILRHHRISDRALVRLYGSLCARCSVPSLSLYAEWPCLDVLDDAATWRDHPDWRQDWAA